MVVSEMAEVVLVSSFAARRGRLLATDGSHLFEPLVSVVKLHTVWAGVIFVKQQLHAERIFLEGDSAIVISWIQRGARQLESHPLIRDV